VEKAVHSSPRIAENDKKSVYERYLSAATGKSNADARAIAQDIVSEPVFWDWDRTCRLYIPS
jgi:isocitrate lyase